MTGKANDRVGQRSGKFTVTRMVHVGWRALCHHVFNDCGSHSSDPVRWSKLKTKRCPACYEIDRERVKEERKRNPKPYVPVMEKFYDKDVDRVYRHFVSMPTHELNNRWNDE